MLKVRGRSDDLVYANIEMQRECPACGCEIEEPSQAVVCDSEDEFGAYEQGVSFTVGGPEGGVIVVAKYERNGTWSGKICQIGRDDDDDGAPIPWPITVEGEGYSVVVKVDCPNGTPVKMEKHSS